MGLDTVELVMAYEEEFGIEIPDEDAEKITTVGEMYRYVKHRVTSVPAVDCLTQKVFYKLRRALIQNYGLQRHMIGPDTILTDLISPKQIEEGWPFLQMFIDLKTPEFKVASDLHVGLVFDTTLLTVKHVIHNLIQINYEMLAPTTPEEKEIWERCIDVVVRQLNIDRNQVHMDASFTRDLGAD